MVAAVVILVNCGDCVVMTVLVGEDGGRAKVVVYGG